ncbi:MATE family multidrug resistance protein [Microvirga flocculans]|uniref:Multidrug-efflux transporter n=1 Tax=Microvirga flocculans TaxID=217168 RepID=A0A7W6IFL6_9HYPH|nr:MATE family efflux transporter [Microvirga flocculans]MBB4040582.1 MATE family multidrug resistance protein [Microvirga flocculans]
MIPRSSPTERAAWLAELRATLSLGWPLVLATMAQNALMTSDVILMGWMGSEALAAGALGTNLYFAFLIFGIGLVNATSPIIAEELGRRRHSVREVRRTVRQGLWASVTVAIPIWIVAWNGEAILLAIGQEPVLAHNAGQYMRALQWSLLPFLFFLVLRSFLAALERPGWALFMGLLAVPVNFAAAYALMFGALGLPALGLIGAGLGTVISSTFMFVALALVILFHPRLRRYHIFGRFWRPDWPRYRTLWRIGIPIGLTLTFEVTIFNAAAMLMGRIGENDLAAHAVALQIASFCFSVPLGISQAVTVRVGRAYGAQDAEGVTRAGWTSFALTMGFMGVTASLMMFAPHLLLGAFLDLSDPDNAGVIALARSFLVVAAIFQLADGAQAVGAGMLRGLQDTRVPMLYAALGYWGVGLPLGVILAFGTSLRGIGIWIGLASGLAAVASLMLWRWLRRDRLGLVTATPQDVQEAFAR